MAVLTLVQGATSEAEARSLFDLAAPAAETATRSRLLDLFHRLYPSPPGPDGHWITPLEPDLLGEELLRQVLSEDVELLDRLLDAATERQRQDALAVVGRLLPDDTRPRGAGRERR